MAARLGSVDRDVYQEFDRKMRALEDWYSDSMQAQAYDAQRGHGAKEHGHVILRAQKYPGPNWRHLWYVADNSPLAQAAILRALTEELYGLDHGPSQAGPASGLHRGTREWKHAIATADGSLRSVGRRFGVSHTEVRRLRIEEAAG